MDTTRSSIICSGALTGTAVAGVLCLLVVIAPTSMNMFPMPPFVCFLFAVFTLGVAAAGLVAPSAALVGAVSATIRIPLLGALLGCSFFLLIGWFLVQRLVSPNDPREEAISLLLLSGAIGYATGAIAALRSRRRTQHLTTMRSVLAYAWLLGPVAASVSVWEGHDLRIQYARSTIENAGGNVTWNACEDPRGYFEVDFRGSQITDTQLKEQTGSLAWIRRLDLNLYGNSITDEGLQHIRHLTNTKRLRLANTLVTDAGVERIKRDLPGVEVRR
jgi:hypothetical protein